MPPEKSVNWPTAEVGAPKSYGSFVPLSCRLIKICDSLKWAQSVDYERLLCSATIYIFANVCLKASTLIGHEASQGPDLPFVLDKCLS